jgi:hypothetical protein
MKAIGFQDTGIIRVQSTLSRKGARVENNSKASGRIPGVDASEGERGRG